jgi:glycosyltransferase involved in cell wall biosynthesis
LAGAGELCSGITTGRGAICENSRVTYGNIREAVESVLDQTELPTELIVVDDGSTDDTADVVARYSQVQLLRQPNMGLAVARNAGLDASRG